MREPATIPMAPVDQATPTSQGTVAPSAEQRLRALVDREELRSEQIRLRRALWVGVVGWSMFIANDVYLYVSANRDLLVHTESMLVRPTIGAVGLAFVIALGKEGWSRRALRAAEVGLFTLSGLGLGLLAALGSEDLRSIHVIAVLLVVNVHTVMIGSTWKRALLPMGLATLAPLAVLLAGALFSTKLAAQWSDPVILTRFVQHYSMIIGGVALTLIGSQVVADLRQQVAEARSIGRYRLRKRLATGGMGEVWVAYHAGLKRDVAVKLMRPQSGNDARAAVRFEREVRATAELTHPNTVRVFDYGVTADGVWYYAMELLEGETLQKIVEREGALGPERALRLITQAAQALAEAHQRGIVHRDVKPPNIFVIQSGGEEYAKLIDFGIARVADEEAELTRTGMVVGTPGYIAPEVLRGSPATTRSDVYALGMTLYFALAGRGPYAGASPEAVVQRAARESAPPLEEAPPELAQIVARCLAREPSERFATAEDLAHALRDCAL